MTGDFTMKKILFFALSVCILVLTVGCSNEPIEFSESLRNNRDCYIDAVEIIPDSYDSNMFCKCILENGNEVWMQISSWEYQEYFDPDFETATNYARSVKFDKPIRLDGKAKETTTSVIDKNQTDIKVFEFAAANKKLTLKSTEKNLAGNEYNDSVNNGKFVYADITHINPTSFYQYSSMTGFNNITSVYFSCQTSTNESIEVLIDVTDYKKYFDENASFYNDPINPRTADPIDFATPIRICGIVEESTFKFAYTDATELERAKAENQPEVKFSDNALLKQKVYAEIKNISPKYVVNNPLTPFSMQYYICLCECTDGTSVWLYISEGRFKECFLNDFIEDMTNIVIELDSVTVKGTVVEAKKIASNISPNIEKDKLISFDSVG